jgi:hypothetical protein
MEVFRNCRVFVWFSDRVTCEIVTPSGEEWLEPKSGGKKFIINRYNQTEALRLASKWIKSHYPEGYDPGQIRVNIVIDDYSSMEG